VHEIPHLGRHQAERTMIGVASFGAVDASHSWIPENAFARINDVNELVRPGDRMFIQCEGGPCLSRLEYFPPRLEISERGGMYVLIDEDEPPHWRYLFVPNEY
jgi:hypothetical protein